MSQNTRIIQKLSLLAVSETESDSDSTEETESEDKCQPALLFVQVKTISSLWQAAKSINYEISQEIFSFLHLSH